MSVLLTDEAERVVDRSPEVHKGTKTLELTQVDGKPFTIQFRVWHPEPEVDAHKMHTDVQNNPDRSQPNEQNPSKINDFPTK